VIALLLAAGSAMVVSLIGTRFFMDWLRAHKFGQPIHDDVPEGHRTKAGTPTMGGVMIVTGAVVGYVVAHLRAHTFYTNTGICVMTLIIGSGIVGLTDDWIKVSRERNLGLNKRAKFGGLLVIATGFTLLVVRYTGIHTTLSFTRFDSPGLHLGTLGWCIWAILLIVGTTNAVNLTDGLDGLAAGSSLYAFVAFMVIGYWGSRSNHLAIYQTPHAFDLAVISASMLGGCVGFLWWNAPPAGIIMGDAGALSIGAALAGLALTTNTQLLLPIIGGLYVLETMSVILQVGSFRLFHRRIFRMAPMHHHFELAGWPETTVIVRFWILAGLCTAVALGIYYADFISLGGLLD
jgi:phospho-N-acetylmuramoyl-pentapeptide-transferase